MGFDEALLHADAGAPTLRLYRWRPAGLSLGYFQRAADFLPGGIAAPAAGSDHVLVRRITGGGAIFHDDEITFSLTLDAELLPEPIATSYDLIHAAVTAALATVGVTARRRGPLAGSCATGRHARPNGAWCFADPACEDLLASDGRKLCGSAQRRLRRPRERVLHHGSLVLSTPEATPFCGSVAATVEPRAIEAELEDALVAHLAAALRRTPESDGPTPAERAEAARLAEQRYASAEFTLRR